MKLSNYKNWKKLYFSKFEIWCIIIISGIFCGVFIYGILSNILDKSTWTTVGGFVFFASCLLIGIWMLVSKQKSFRYIYRKGWKYNLYKRGNKCIFILITGIIKSTEITCILTILHYLNLFLPNIKLNNVNVILSIIVTFFIVTLISGYVEYKKITE